MIMAGPLYPRRGYRFPQADPESVQEAESVLRLYQQLLTLGIGDGDALCLAITGVGLDQCRALIAQGCPLQLVAPILS